MEETKKQHEQDYDGATVTGSIPEGKPDLQSGPFCISEVQAHSLEACKGQTDFTSCYRNLMSWFEPYVNWSNSYIGQMVHT